MKHPNTDTIYCLSYPRSGSSWFRYCFAFVTETNTDSNQEMLYHSHTCQNDVWTLQNTYDTKTILLLRNYKEAIFSELNNIYSRNPIAILEKLLRYVKDNPGIVSKNEFKILAKESWDSTEEDVDNMLAAFKIKQYLKDFSTPSFPSLNIEELFPPAAFRSSFPTQFVRVLHNLSVHHYHFALQLKNYYELLEYHDNVASLNPNNALIIRYEDLMQNPFVELDKVIDFMDKNHCATPEQISRYGDRLHILMANITSHKMMSINQYRSQGHMATSYKRDSTHDYHRQMGQKAGLWDKSFLLDTDRVLKNKNPELFNKYLSDYEEKAN
tara:strand:- start:301 stop:1278 length:978 start_codon:yes stop_codon:yes gene_type:complete